MALTPRAATLALALAGCASLHGELTSPSYDEALAHLTEAARQPTEREAHTHVKQALADLERRVTVESDARLKALLAETLLLRGLQDRAVRQRARTLATAALAIDPDLARAHSALGWLTFMETALFNEALGAFERALQLQADLHFARFGYGLTLAASGDLERGLAEVERAERSGLVRPNWRMGSQSILFFMRRYAEAAQRAVMPLTSSLEPDFFWQGIALVGAGDTKGAIAALEERVRQSNRIPGAVAMLATAYAADGQPDRARKLLPELQATLDRRVQSGEPGCAHNPCYLYALVYLALGERDAALNMLDRAVQESLPGVWYIWSNVDPRWDPVRQDPRFVAIIRKAGLEPD
jgi:tetratricopeptide (TPR) repeat protein